MPDPLRPTSSPRRDYDTNDFQSGDACVPPDPGKSEAPPKQPAAPMSSEEPSPAPRAVDFLVTRAPKRPLPADLPAERAAARTLAPQAEAGVTRSGDHYAGFAAVRGKTAQAETFELFSMAAQGGGHNELSATAFRLQGQSTDGRVEVTSEALSAKATASTRMLPGCEGPYVNAGAVVALSEWTFVSPDGAEQSSYGLSVAAGPGFEGGICIRDKDDDGLPETCIRVGAGPFVLTDCSEADVPNSEDAGTGGGPGQGEDWRPPNLGAGGAPGR